MALTAGTRLGPYEVVAQIGAGGMGEVYRARDTKLNRDVAIKVLPDAVGADPDRLARFEREAQALASLNHPNIAAVYAVEGRAIVMELVAGEDLSARIARGPIALAEALPLARQIADALAAAHEAGIVHRDLKPANIKVKDDGTVKVLDFGLAKALAPDGANATAEAMNSPTLTARATQMGTILGTAAYMAPEQAKGKIVDKRADIWAFGVVLYEMLTGTRPFVGEDVTDILAAVVRAEPDWTTLPAATPALVRRLLVRCLTKDVKQRLHDIADARLEIDETVAARTDAGSGDATRAPNANAWPRGRALALSLVAFLVGGLAVGTVVWRLKPAAAAPVAYVSLDVRPAEELNAGGSGSVLVPAGGARTALAWSPDGRALAFVGRKAGVQQLYVRDLGSDAARPLPGTEGAQTPAFSPDGQWLAFAAAGAIHRVAIASGPPAKMCDVVGGGAVNGITWGNGRLIYADARRLVGFSPSDPQCAATKVTDPSPEGVRHASPQILPGDTAVLYTEHGKNWTSGDEHVMVKRLPDGAPQQLLPDAADARYLPTGHVVFLRQGTLFAVGFDAATLTVRGLPVALLNEVSQTVAVSMASDLTLAGQFAISPQGTLAYVSRPLVWSNALERIAIDRRGNITPRGPLNGSYGSSALSPSGTQLAVPVASGKEFRLYLDDLTRGGALTLLAGAAKGEVSYPAWSRDNRLAFSAYEGGTNHVVLIRPGTSTPPEVVPDSTGFAPGSWSRDGHLLAGTRAGDLWILSPDDTPKLRPFLQTADASESNPAWSPDGHWLAYQSNATRRAEIYVRPYPGPGSATLVSTSGGSSPAWNPNGRELFYYAPGPGAGPERRMMAVNMATPLHPGSPEPLFPFSSDVLRIGCAPTTCYAVSPDGQQFFGGKGQPQAPNPVTHVTVVLNWFEAVKSKLAPGR